MGVARCARYITIYSACILRSSLTDRTYCHQGLVDDARIYIKRGLAIRRDYVRPNHAVILESLDSLALLRETVEVLYVRKAVDVARDNGRV